MRNNIYVFFIIFYVLFNIIIDNRKCIVYNEPIKQIKNFKEKILMKMQEKKLKRFRVYEVIANVLFIIILVVGAVGLLAAIAGEIAVSASQLDISGLAQKLITTYVPAIEIPEMPTNAFFHTLIIAAITAAAVGLAFVCYLFKAVSRLFGNIVKTETPFHEKSIRILKSIGISFFVYTAVLFIVNLVFGAVMQGMFPLGGFNFDISIRFSTIIYGLLILALAEIFEFGAGLQQDSESIV